MADVKTFLELSQEVLPMKSFYTGKYPDLYFRLRLMGYGTGAVMAVPAHDERDHRFAKKIRFRNYKSNRKRF